MTENDTQARIAFSDDECESILQSGITRIKESEGFSKSDRESHRICMQRCDCGILHPWFELAPVEKIPMDIVPIQQRYSCISVARSRVLSKGASGSTHRPWVLVGMIACKPDVTAPIARLRAVRSRFGRPRLLAPSKSYFISQLITGIVHTACVAYVANSDRTRSYPSPRLVATYHTISC